MQPIPVPGDAQRALCRGLAMLEHVADAPCTVGALADALECDKSTASRQLAALEQHGWVRRGPDGFVLGVRALGLGFGARQPVLARHAQQLADRLTELTECTTLVSTLHGARGVRLAQACGPLGPGLDEFPVSSDITTTARTATGLVLLAQLSDAQVVEVLGGSDQDADLAGLLAEVGTVRGAPSAMRVGRLRAGLAAVAVPWSGTAPLPGVVSCLANGDAVMEHEQQVTRIMLDTLSIWRRRR